MQRFFGLAICAALLLSGGQAQGQSVTFDFEDGTDQGWGAGFGNDASQAHPIVNIGGSNRMGVLRDGGFQEAGRESGNVAEPFFIAMNAASINESLYNLSYDWYVDTSPGNYGTFLQLGTYVNTGNGYYAQDFPNVGKDVELDSTQLASGGVFSGTVSETFAAKGFDLPLAQTFMRLGLIVNGDGAATVYFDNINISLIPEPATLALAGLGGLGLLCMRRRK
jgi:PEP-CTERM motif